jgi:hypothetical protein
VIDAHDLSPPAPAEPLCRNCGAVAPGTFCPNCGQETSLALPTVRALLREAAGRYVAFDGRMWRTLFGLWRPGFLTREYLAGRRRRYIRPARLFLVLSIGLFALLRFEGLEREHQLAEGIDTAEKNTVEAEAAAKSGAGKAGRANADAVGKKQTAGDVTTGSTELYDMFDLSEPGLEPLNNRAKAFKRLSRKEQIDQIFSGVFRYGPYAMFALLPLFALLLKVVYVGRSRRYPLRPRRYAAHLVFGAHNHAYLFLTVALLVLLPGGPVYAALMIWTPVYLLLSMRAVYGGRWSGMIARAAVIFVVYLIFFVLFVLGLVVAAILLG